MGIVVILNFDRRGVMNRAALCIKMLKILKSRDIVSTAELAELLKTNPRNIREFRKELEAAGYHIEEKKGRYGGYYLDDRDLIQIPKLTKEQLQVLAHARQFIKAHAEFAEGDQFEEIMDDVAAAGSSYSNREMPEIGYSFSVDRHSGLTDHEREMLSQVLASMKSSYSVELSYMKRGVNEPASILVDPYHVVNIEDNWYMIGWSHSAKAFRNFRFSDERMLDIKLTQRRFTKDPNFNFKNFIGIDSAFKGKLNLYEVEVNPDHARLFREDFKGRELSQKENRNGKCVFSFTADNQYQVYQLLFRFGDAVELILPVEFRDEYIKRIASIAKVYGISLDPDD